ncbi:colicin import membrane protein [Inhella inkyongensis]|uniref:Colicin import membrane protein n=1 Tax=Inhella inkyongensis TaxID=392593 RepID=A0A840S6F6_9BURK|nr:cell envelope integrity protein TolA [Inhella inkyongensis]MBB5204181.1 colicin import membrane protein [Inhella inkyongensis]
MAPSLRPESPVGLWRGAGMALLAHGLLLLALKAGLDWRSHAEPALEAELWSAIPQAAAPRAQEPEPEPQPKVEPKADPKPQPRPEPDRAQQQAQQQAQRDAEIAIEREREKKRREQVEARERAELLKKEQAKKAAEAERLKQEQAKLEKQKTEQTKRQQAQEEARREAQRQENLRRIQGLAGASGGPQSSGTALQSSGPSANYAGRIKARVRPNIVFSEVVSGNPQAEVEVRCAPDGLILSSRLLKPSGHATWDQAVLRAIEKTERLPRDTDGRVPASLVLVFRPNE